MPPEEVGLGGRLKIPRFSGASELWDKNLDGAGVVVGVVDSIFAEEMDLGALACRPPENKLVLDEDVTSLMAEAKLPPNIDLLPSAANPLGLLSSSPSFAFESR